MSNGGPRQITATEQLPAGMSSSGRRTPNVARIYDYFLGGKDNYAEDREAARIVLGTAPDVPLAALENREFVRRAVQYVTEERAVDQFIDIGPGLPTQGNVHQIARQYEPQARVVYVDNDPVVVAYGRALLEDASNVCFVDGDLRAPRAILEQASLRELIDLARPVALCLSLVVHFITDEDGPYALVAELRNALCPGSYLILSHVTGDERDPRTVRNIRAVYDDASAPLVPRSKAEVARFFDGFDPIEPGVVFLSQWRPATEFYARGGTRWAYAGVGRKSPTPGN